MEEPKNQFIYLKILKECAGKPNSFVTKIAEDLILQYTKLKHISHATKTALKDEEQDYFRSAILAAKKVMKERGLEEITFDPDMVDFNLLEPTEDK